MENQIIIKLKENKLEAETEKNLKETFMPFFDQADQLKEDAKNIIVSNANQVKEMEQARDARLKLKDIRVNVEKTRKRLKEDSLRKGKAIDGMANIIKYLIVPIEDHLEQQEKYIEIQEDNKKIAAASIRATELTELEFNIDGFDLKAMKEETYNNLLKTATIAYKENQDRIKKEEADRIDKEKEEAIEMEKIKNENIRLQKEADEREKHIAIEREKEEKKREKTEKELQTRREAEEKIKQEREAKEIKLRMAGDKEKLILYAETLKAIPLINVKNQEAKAIINEAYKLVQQAYTYIINNAKEFE